MSTSPQFRKLVRKGKSSGGRVPKYSTALVIPRGVGSIIPDAAVAKLKFAYFQDAYNDVASVWTFGTALNIRVNNAYDPITGTHQPYGWDQMAALYRFYKVIGCRMKFTLLNAVAAQPVILAIRPVPVNENLSIAGTNVGQALERPATIAVYSVSSGGPCPTRTLDVNIPHLLGITKEQFLADVSEYSAATTAAPSRYAYVQIALAGPSITTSHAYVGIEVEYTIQYWQRITLAQS
jgi:hypothetical protein